MSFFDTTYGREEELPEEPETGTEEETTEETSWEQEDIQPKEQSCCQRGIGAGKVILASFLVLLLIAAGCLATACLVNDYWAERYTALNQYVRDSLQVMQQDIDDMSGRLPSAGEGAENADELKTPGDIYRENLDTVVAISSVTVTEYMGQHMEGESTGTGFVFTEDGYIVTNYHVVEGANKITVTCHDKSEYDATIMGFDQTNDIAVLKVEANLKAVKIGSSDVAAVGDRVCAIGNPMGEFISTMTVGYVSAKDRIVTTEGTTINMLQTDAAINPGNSGGPLFNMNGEVIGITTAKYSGVTSSGVTIEGIGFAIPIDDVLNMLEDLCAYGYVTGAYMGVTVRNVEDNVLVYGIPKGVFVQEVVEDGASYKAGIQAGDVITNMGGYEVTCLTDLSRALRKFKAGDSASVTVFRAGQIVNLTIVFDEKPVPVQ